MKSFAARKFFRSQNLRNVHLKFDDLCVKRGQQISVKHFQFLFLFINFCLWVYRSGTSKHSSQCNWHFYVGEISLKKKSSFVFFWSYLKAVRELLLLFLSFTLCLRAPADIHSQPRDKSMQLVCANGLHISFDVFFFCSFFLYPHTSAHVLHYRQQHQMPQMTSHVVAIAQLPHTLYTAFWSFKSTCCFFKLGFFKPEFFVYFFAIELIKPPDTNYLEVFPYDFAGELINFGYKNNTFK